MGVNKSHPATLCWSCQNTDRYKCTWFDPDNQQPILGWTAEKDYRNGVGETYHVTACPNYLPVARAVEAPPPNPTGVRYDRRNRRWIAQIHCCGKYYYLGGYKEQEDAIAVRLAAEKAIEQGEELCRKNRRYNT